MSWIRNVSMSDIKTGQYLQFAKNTSEDVLIQIVDPAYQFPQPKSEFKEVHQFEFLDAEDKCGFDDDFKISPKQAQELNKIILEWTDAATVAGATGRIALSQPIASDSRSERSASSGPIEIVVTWAPNRSLSMSASSIAYRSRGLIMLSSPDRTIVPVSGSILTLSVSGTCFIRTMMCIEKLRIVSLTQEYDTKV